MDCRVGIYRIQASEADRKDGPPRHGRMRGRPYTNEPLYRSKNDKSVTQKLSEGPNCGYIKESFFANNLDASIIPID